MKKEYIRKRVEKRLRRLANEEGLTYAEVIKVFKSQFRFVRETIESKDEDWYETAEDEELEKLAFNLVYIGKIYASSGLRRKLRYKEQLKKQDEKRQDTETD